MLGLSLKRSKASKPVLDIVCQSGDVTVLLSRGMSSWTQVFIGDDGTHLHRRKDPPQCRGRTGKPKTPVSSQWLGLVWFGLVWFFKFLKSLPP